MNKSNLLTFARLILGPVFVVFFFTGFDPGEPVWCLIVALVLSLLIEATDLMDGILARKFNHITEFGKLFDPFADSLSRFTLFLAFFGKGLAPIWMILILFYRDSTVAFVRALAANRNKIVSARTSGKRKAMTQAIGINVIVFLTILYKIYPSIPLNWISWGIMLIITLVTAYSWVDYLQSAIPVLKSYEK